MRKMIIAVRPYAQQNVQRQNFEARNQVLIDKIRKSPTSTINNVLPNGDFPLIDIVDSLNAVKDEKLVGEGFMDMIKDNITHYTKRLSGK